MLRDELETALLGELGHEVDPGKIILSDAYVEATLIQLTADLATLTGALRADVTGLEASLADLRGYVYSQLAVLRGDIDSHQH